MTAHRQSICSILGLLTLAASLCSFGLFSVGCSSLLISEEALTQSPSLLKAASASADAVTIDIYWATLPDDADETLWRYVQEDRLDSELRGQLIQNGFRAGIVGGVPPEQIVKLLNPTGHSTDNEENALAVTLDSPTGVSRSTKQLRPGKSATIQASEIIERAPLLLADGGPIHGKTYKQVQPVYDVQVERDGEGGYSVVITPELHFGDTKMRWNSDEMGMMSRGIAQREREIFSNLRIKAPLVVGEMLIATSLPNADSRLGYYFHKADETASSHRKAIVIRLTQAPSKAFDLGE